MTYWTHNKTGKRYRFLAAATDCTNVRDGTSVVVYCPDDCEHTIYVREQSEFEAKFTPEPAYATSMHTAIAETSAALRASQANAGHGDDPMEPGAQVEGGR